MFFLIIIFGLSGFIWHLLSCRMVHETNGIGKKHNYTPQKKSTLLSLNHLVVMLLCVVLASNLVVELRPWKTTMEPKNERTKNPSSNSPPLWNGRSLPSSSRNHPLVPSPQYLKGLPSGATKKKKRPYFSLYLGCLIGIPGSLKWIYMIPVWLGSISQYD